MSKHWFIGHLIEKYSKNQKFGLDIGIGYDNWAEFKKCKMIGIDRKEDSKADIVTDLEQPLPFQNDSFDTVVSINSFNYVKNSRQLLSEVNRILKRNGILICVVDNEKSTSQPFVWQQRYLNRLLRVTGFSSILSKNFKDKMYAWWYNKSSVYAFAVAKKIVLDKKSKSKTCAKCGEEVQSEEKKDELGNIFHIKCPPKKKIKFAKSYNIYTTHPEN